MTPNSCRWGILGAAAIARKNWQAIRDAGNATLIAVASREVSRAATFISECQQSAPHPVIPEAMGSYEDLLARPDIDAVYIPLPTGLRKEWVLRAAAAGKHVLVEKPVGCTSADVEEIIAACEKHNVQFMDGVMFMHNSRLQQMRHAIDQHVGAIRHISSQFSFLGGDEFQRGNIRTHGTLEPLGCLGDLGWYCTRFSLWALDYTLPVSVTAHMHSEVRQSADANPVPQEFSATLHFANGIHVSFYCSFTAGNAQWANISGDRGLLQLSDFVLPFSGEESEFKVLRSEFVTDGSQFNMHENGLTIRATNPSNNAPGSQEANMIKTMSTLVLTGQHDAHWPEISLKTQRVLDACLTSARKDGARVTL